MKWNTNLQHPIVQRSTRLFIDLYSVFMPIIWQHSKSTDGRSERPHYGSELHLRCKKHRVNHRRKYGSASFATIWLLYEYHTTPSCLGKIGTSCAFQRCCSPMESYEFRIQEYFFDARCRAERRVVRPIRSSHSCSARRATTCLSLPTSSFRKPKRQSTTSVAVFS